MSKTKAKPSDKRGIRCAVYTRKSTEEGLQQEFNSLDAPRESGEAYIAAQKHQGLTCLPDRYDDGGFSGGNMERPALQRLMKDIQAGRVDGVVVYKVDASPAHCWTSPGSWRRSTNTRCRSSRSRSSSTPPTPWVA